MDTAKARTAICKNRNGDISALSIGERRWSDVGRKVAFETEIRNEGGVHLQEGNVQSGSMSRSNPAADCLSTIRNSGFELLKISTSHSLVMIKTGAKSVGVASVIDIEEKFAACLHHIFRIGVVFHSDEFIQKELTALVFELGVDVLKCQVKDVFLDDFRVWAVVIVVVVVVHFLNLFCQRLNESSIGL